MAPSQVKSKRSKIIKVMSRERPRKGRVPPVNDDTLDEILDRYQIPEREHRCVKCNFTTPLKQDYVNHMVSEHPYWHNNETAPTKEERTLKQLEDDISQIMAVKKQSGLHLGRSGNKQRLSPTAEGKSNMIPNPFFSQSSANIPIEKRAKSQSSALITIQDDKSDSAKKRSQELAKFEAYQKKVMEYRAKLNKEKAEEGQLKNVERRIGSKT